MVPPEPPLLTSMRPRTLNLFIKDYTACRIGEAIDELKELVRNMNDTIFNWDEITSSPCALDLKPMIHNARELQSRCQCGGKYDETRSRDYIACTTKKRREP